jgi:hypothetical protein
LFMAIIRKIMAYKYARTTSIVATDESISKRLHFLNAYLTSRDK